MTAQPIILVDKIVAYLIFCLGVGGLGHGCIQWADLTEVTVCLDALQRLVTDHRMVPPEVNGAYVVRQGIGEGVADEDALER